MKTLTLTFSLVFLLSTITLAQSKDEKALEEAVESLSKAMIDGNETILTSLTSKDLSYGHSSGNIEDQQTYLGAIVSGEANYHAIDITDQTIAVSGSTGIVRHIMDVKVNDFQIKLGVMMVWRKEGKHWKLIARQGYRLPE